MFITANNLFQKRAGATAGRDIILRRLAQFGALALVLFIIAGCAHNKPAKVLPPAAPPYDPVALQAKSLEVARKLMQNSMPASVDYEIGPLDVLEISVFDVSKYTTTARVGGDGTIRFPDLGIIRAEGMGERRLEDLIQRQLKEKELVINPQVTVFVKELHAREVAIAGEVKTPGVYPIRGGESLMDLISKAGGLSQTAGSYAYIIRGSNNYIQKKPGLAFKAGGVSPENGNYAYAGRGDKDNTPKDIPLQVGLAAPSTVRVDLVGLLMRGEHQWNVPLQAGDQVTIPTAGFVHVTGLGVEKPGTYQLRASTTMLRQAVDEAGGLKFAADHKLLMVRRNLDGRQETFLADYDKIMKDEKYDIALQGGDTIVVNRTAFKTLLSVVGTGAEKIFRFSIGGYVPLFGDSYYGY